MQVSGNQIVHAEQFVRKLRGSSQPMLVRASDGQLYVAKFRMNLQGPNVLFNEAAGTELYRAFGLSVPAWKQLLVSEEFIDNNPDCWIQTADGVLRPNAGLCFGSQHLGTNGARLLEILSGSGLKRVRNQMSFWMAWLLDICAEHVDNRQAIFVEDATGGSTAFFVDHGHLFGGPTAGQRLNFLASRYLDPRMYPEVGNKQAQEFFHAARNLNVDLLWRRIQALPTDWKTESGLGMFAECLFRLSDPAMLRDIFDSLVESVQRTNQRHQPMPAIARPAPLMLVFPGMQTAPVEQRPATLSACA